MQQDTQFIKNIVGLTTPIQLQARIAELQEAFQDGVALSLVKALIGISAVDHPLIKQLSVVQMLQEYITRNPVMDNKKEFVRFLDLLKTARMLEKVKKEAAEHQGTPQGQGVTSLRTEEVDNEDEDEEISEHSASVRTLLDPRVNSPMHVASPTRGRSVFAAMLDRVTSPIFHPEAQEAQQALLNSMGHENLTQLRQVTHAAIERYPATFPNQSAVKSLDNFSQFLIFLMEDALQQLHGLLQYPQYEHFRDDGEYQLFITNLAPLFKKYAANSNYLPSSQLIAALNSKQSVSQFLSGLESQDRALVTQGSPLDSQISTSQRTVRPSSRDVGVVRTQQHPTNPVETIAVENELENTVAPFPSAPTPSLASSSEKVYPLPAYLARSLMDKLAHAITVTAKKLSQSSVRDVFNVSGTNKASKMTEVAKVLRAHPPRPTLREIYQIKHGEETLQAILHEKRGRYESGAFSKTLANAGQEFLAENPASLMRQYVFLTQLATIADFNNPLNKPIHAQHISNTITKMSVLRKAMKHFYSADRSAVSSADMKKYMWELIELAKEYPDVALHVRVLLVAFLDTLNEKDFKENNKRIKLWLLNRTDSFTPHELKSKQFILTTVAKNIESDTAVCNQPNGIRAWERALLEVSAFQQSRYDADYTSQDHQIKIESALLPLSVSLNKYFRETSQKDVSIMLELFNENSYYNAVAEANPQGYFVGAGKGYKTDLRLSTNLKAYWQAALASNLSLDPVIATTLAIVNSGDADALTEWKQALSTPVAHSVDVQINAWMLRSMQDEQKEEYDGEREVYGVAAFNEIASKKEFNKREEYYLAILSFAGALLQHVKNDQSKSTIVRQELVTLCCVVERHITMLKSTVESEVINVRKAFQHDLHLQEYQRCREEGQSQEDAEENARLASNRLDYCMTPKDLEDQGVPAQPLVALEKHIKAFNDHLAAVCYSAAVSESVKAIRTEIFGEHVFNPHVGAAFETEFTLALANIDADDSFFIDALFTSEHHPMEEKTIIAMCKRIADNSRLNLVQAQAWHSLSMRFYGNSQALSDLSNHYLKGNTKKALKIALFGFSDKHFSADKQAFAQLILQVFATEVTENITPQSNVKILQEAMEFLVNHPPRVSAKEHEAIKMLRNLAKAAGEDVEDNYDALDLCAQQQAVVYNETAQTVMGLSVSYYDYAERYREAHAQHVENLSLASPQHPSMNRRALPAKTRAKDFLAQIVKTAFPKDFRYYASLASAQAHKYERDDESSPDPLIGVLWQQILAIKAELNCKDIDSMVLETAINDLRGVHRQVRNSEGAWVDVKPQSLLFIYPRRGNVNAIDKTASEIVQRTGKVTPLALAQINAHKDPFGDRGFPLTFFAKQFHGLVLETKGALLQMEIPTGGAIDLAPAASVAIEPVIISDEEIRSAYQKDIDHLVLKTVKVLLTEHPTNDNFSDDDRKILGEEPIDQGRINDYQERIRKLDVGDSFKRRVRLIRDKKYDRCINDIFTHRAVKGGRTISGNEELTDFITQLKAKADAEQPAGLYQQYLDDFIWAVAEKGALAEIAADNPSDDPSNEFLAVLKECEFDWDYLIALGCQRYAAMSHHASSQEKGHRLLSALKYLATPLTQILSKEVYIEINALLVKVMSTLGGEKKLSDVRARIREYLHTIKGKKVNKSDLIGIDSELLAHFRDDHEEEKQNQPRRDYAAFFPGIALKRFNPETGKGIDAYSDIYSLAQAASQVGQFIEDDTHRGIDELNDNDTGAELTDETPSKARALLKRLHTLLCNDETFATWHRESLIMGKKFPSSLDVLIRHLPHQSETLDALYKDDRSNEILKHLKAINNHSHYWKNIYGIDTDYADQAAYVALAVYELEQLMTMDKLANVEFTTKYVSRNKESIEHTQRNHVIEQMGLIFLAAKHFYQDKYNDKKNAISAPFTQALLNIADARGCDAESIIEELLAKACDSFNLMLNPPKEADEIEDYENSYELAITENSALKLEMMEWIKSIPGIRAIYVAQTLDSGIHCEEQAAFVLDQLSVKPLSVKPQPCQDNVPTRQLSHSSQSTVAENAVNETPPVNSLNVDEQQLLFLAFDWHYQYVDAGKSQALFELDKVTKRLDAFVKTCVEKRNLWQDYYAYIAQLSENGYQGMHFADPGTVQDTKYLLLHADKIWALLDKHPCENKTVLQQVMLYLLASWSKSSARCSISMKDKIGFIDSLRFQSLRWFKDLTSDEIGKLTSAEFDRKMHESVSSEIRNAIDKLMKNLGMRRNDVKPAVRVEETAVIAAPVAVELAVGDQQDDEPTTSTSNRSDSNSQRSSYHSNPEGQQVVEDEEEDEFAFLLMAPDTSELEKSAADQSAMDDSGQSSSFIQEGQQEVEEDQSLDGSRSGVLSGVTLFGNSSYNSTQDTPQEEDESKEGNEDVSSFVASPSR